MGAPALEDAAGRGEGSVLIGLYHGTLLRRHEIFCLAIIRKNLPSGIAVLQEPD
jgi:hypothetical protein